MKQITQFPRIPFAVLPTPLYKLEAISREYGKNIYIKRDDMIGVALGGNKVRKLEFLLADAQANGADVVLTAEVRSRTMPCSLPRVPRSSV